MPQLSASSSNALFFVRRQLSSISRPPISNRLTVLQREPTRPSKRDWCTIWEARTSACSQPRTRIIYLPNVRREQHPPKSFNCTLKGWTLPPNLTQGCRPRRLLKQLTGRWHARTYGDRSRATLEQHRGCRRRTTTASIDAHGSALLITTCGSGQGCTQQARSYYQCFKDPSSSRNAHELIPGESPMFQEIRRVKTETRSRYMCRPWKKGFVEWSNASLLFFSVPQLGLVLL